MQQASLGKKLALAAVLALAASAKLAVAQAKPISFAAVERVALAHTPNAVIDSIERERWRGQLVFEVELNTPDGVRLELIVDAYNGKVLKQKVDD
jgi:uncharacterized membrane protein YkoI